MDERWVPIAGNVKYEVSNQGRVRNVATGHILNQHTINNTPTVNLQGAGRVMCRSVPKLVREAFGE